MALNFSHRPIFPSGLSEDNLVSPMRMGNGYRVEGISEKNGSGSGGDGFGNGWHDVDNCFDYGSSDRGGASGTQDSVSKDILDLLPSDPFGMDISTTFTAITGWLEDLDFDYGGYRDEIGGVSGENYPLFAGLNFIWNNAVRFHNFPQGGSVCIEEKISRGASGLGECSGRDVGEASCSYGSGSSCDMDGVLGFKCGYEDVASMSGDTKMDEANCHEGGDSDCPISLSLRYLSVFDLLVVERVCKNLHYVVHNDTLLWKSIHIDQPLNERITDDSLFELTRRAQGGLECLSLVECTRITDDGLRRVLLANSKLIKLSVPGCTRLSIEGIVGMLKDHNSKGSQRVKHLHIGGLFGVTQNHFDEIKLLLDTNSKLQEHPKQSDLLGTTDGHSHKPHFYCRWKLYLPLDDDRSLDIEACPRCQKFRLIYDCPAKGCQGGVGHATQVCRACSLCIPRCSQCGRCINDSEYEETFCLEWLCSFCSQHLVKMLGREDEKVGLVSSGLPEQT